MSKSNRFRYLDSRGEEVSLANPEALAFRIQTGDIDESTLLFDSTTDQWAPAGTLPIYQFVLEEIVRGGDPASRKEKAPWDAGDVRDAPAGGGDSGTDEAAAEKGQGRAGGKKSVASKDPATSGGKGASDSPSGKKGKDTSAPAKTGDAPAGKPATGDTPTGKAPTGEAPTGEAPTGEAPTGKAPTGKAPTGDTPTGKAAPATAGKKPDDADGAAVGGAPHESDTPDTFDGFEGGAAWAPHREPASGGPSGRKTAPDAPPPPPGPKPAVTRTPVQRKVSRHRRRKKSRLPGALVIGVGVVIVAGGSFILLSRSSDAERVEGIGEVAEASIAAYPDSLPLPGDLRIVLDETVRSARDGMIASMDSLQQTFHLGEAPPSAWLGGFYLANASGFFEVRDYWERYQSSVAFIRREDARLFETSLDTHLRLSLVSGDTLALLRRRALAEFEKDRPERDAAYDQMEELARAAIALHDLLVLREDDIAYEPAAGAAVSRDPVLEAVPVDSVLATQMWREINRILSALEASQGVQPVSTQRMVRTLFDRLGVRPGR